MQRDDELSFEEAISECYDELISELRATEHNGDSYTSIREAILGAILLKTKENV